MKLFIRSLLPVRWVAAALMIVMTCVTAISVHAQQSMYVTGYWPTWAYPMTVEQANWTGMTHAIFFTAAPVQTAPYLNVLVTSSDSVALENNGSDVGMVGRFVAAAHAHGVKALLCIGGIYGTQSSNMAYIASDSTRADIFATASVAYAKRRGFDGIDVDWEPPANYNDNMRLLRLLRRELDKGMTYVAKGLLTIACAEGSTNKWDPVWCNQNVDQMNLMLYDFWQLGSGICFSCDADRVGHNAALHRPDASHGTVMYNNQVNYDADEPNSPLGASTIANPKHGPRAFLKAGFSAAHLSAGIPFYGYVFNNVVNLGDLRNGSNNDYTTYASIINAMNAGGMTYHWDDAAKVPYLTGTPSSASYPFNRAKPVVVTYDDTMSIRLKTEWTKQLGLGGVMIYDLSMGWVNTASPKDPLLRAVVRSVGSPVSPADTTHPVVSITAPANGDSIVTGTTVSVKASATDNIGVAHVDLLVNGTVTSSATAAPYSFNWTTTGLTGAQTLAARAYDAAGNSTLSAIVTVRMKAGSVAIPAVPVLSSPANGATGQSVTPAISWVAVTGASTYRLQVSTGSGFTSLLLDDSSLTTASRQMSSLTNGTLYYWRVSAKNSAGSSAFSTAWNFTTQTAVPPPASGDVWLYQDVLTSPWTNVSWNSTITFNSTEHVYSGSTSLKSVQTAWGGIVLHNATAINPASFGRLEFEVYNTSPGLTLNMFLGNDQNASFPQTSLQSNIPVNQWTLVSVPMSKLNPNNLTLNLVTIMNYTGSSVTYFVDNLRLVANSSVPAVPVELTPANGATGQSVSPTLSWGSVTGATSYRLQVSTGSGFTVLTLDDSSLTAASRQVMSLANSTFYYWRVSAKNSSGTSGFSAAWNFTTVAAPVQPPATPIMASPANGATGQSASPTFSWRSVTGATSYRLQVSTASGFATLLLDDSSLTTASRQMSSLANGTLYYWHVSAKNSGGSSAFSAAWSFTTQPLPTSNLWIYQDALNSPWANYSWSSTITFNSTEHVFAGSSSIKAVASAWGGVGLHNGPWGIKGINPALYSSLEFAVYTASTGLTLNIVLSNEQNGTFPQANLQANVPVNQWIVVSMPVSRLNPNNLPINQISIQNYTGSAGTFFIDNLRFVGATVVAMDAAARSGPEPVVATEYAMAQNFPNPFNPTTSVRFTLPVDSRVDMAVYNSIGQQVRSLISGEVRGAGTWSAEFDGSGLPSGMYFCRFRAVSIADETVSFSQVRKMLFVK